ncbi:hypothetical protein ALC57_14212, partial [Trachymyrmex cornetzi]
RERKESIKGKIILDHLIVKPKVGSDGTSSKKGRNEAEDRIETESEFLGKFESHKEGHKIQKEENHTRKKKRHQRRYRRI